MTDKIKDNLQNEENKTSELKEEDMEQIAGGMMTTNNMGLIYEQMKKAKEYGDKNK